MGLFDNPRLEAKVDRLINQVAGLKLMLNQIITQEKTVMATQADVKTKLDALTADVADETTQIGGVEQVLDNLETLLKSLQGQVANADVPQAIVDQIDALAGAVSGNKARIIADIQKNTPQSP